jgi:hypothetical protein
MCKATPLPRLCAASDMTGQFYPLPFINTSSLLVSDDILISIINQCSYSGLPDQVPGPVAIRKISFVHFSLCFLNNERERQKMSQ